MSAPQRFDHDKVFQQIARIAGGSVEILILFYLLGEGRTKPMTAAPWADMFGCGERIVQLAIRRLLEIGAIKRTSLNVAVSLGWLTRREAGPPRAHAYLYEADTERWPELAARHAGGDR